MAASAMPDGSCQVTAIDDPILLRRLIDMRDRRTPGWRKRVLEPGAPHLMGDRLQTAQIGGNGRRVPIRQQPIETDRHRRPDDRPVRPLSASVHLPMPVSGSGVMLGTTTCPIGLSSNSKPPANVMFTIGLPDASRGVWQLPQAATVVTSLVMAAPP